MKNKMRKAVFPILIGCVLLTIVGCSQRSPVPADASADAKARVSRLKCIQQGIASWYGKYFKGKKTASGEKFDPKAMTAASKKFSLGTELKVINLDNNRDVIVTVNDRGPYVGDRIIDMSEAAAQKLGMKEEGLADVCVIKVE